MQRGAPHRAWCSRASRGNPEPAHVRERLHRKVPVRYAPVHLEGRELRLGVKRYALDPPRDSGTRFPRASRVRRVTVWCRTSARPGVGGTEGASVLISSVLLVIFVGSRSHLMALPATATKSRVGTIASHDGEEDVVLSLAPSKA